MCTIVLLRRPHHPWPLLIAANRDEMMERPWLPPARHWPDRPEVIAGRDLTAGGTWLGINDAGVVAAILNRRGTLGPAPDKRSRGELPLEALDHADAVEAVAALKHLNGTAFRPFNMIVADNRDAFWLRNQGHGAIEVLDIPEGLSMLAAHELNDGTDQRIARYLPQFRDAEPPTPETGGWVAWQELLAAGGGTDSRGMRFCRADGFGTVCSTLVALPSTDRLGEPPAVLFAAGAPGDAPFQPVTA